MVHVGFGLYAARVVVAHLSFSFLMWVVLFGLLLGTDQLDPMALQKNMFPSCNVCADRDMGYKRMYYIHTLYSTDTSSTSSVKTEFFSVS